MSPLCDICGSAEGSLLHSIICHPVLGNFWCDVLMGFLPKINLIQLDCKLAIFGSLSCKAKIIGKIKEKEKISSDPLSVQHQINLVNIVADMS